MGTWSTGIFDDDIAIDVKAEFDETITEGISVKEATKMDLESFEDVLEDDDAPIVYLTIAVLQIKKGTIQKNIKEKALEIIESGHGLDRLEILGGNEVSNRIVVINKLRDKLKKES